MHDVFPTYSRVSKASMVKALHMAEYTTMTPAGKSEGEISTVSEFL